MEPEFYSEAKLETSQGLPADNHDLLLPFYWSSNAFPRICSTYFFKVFDFSKVDCFLLNYQLRADTCDRSRCPLTSDEAASIENSFLYALTDYNGANRAIVRCQN